MPRMAESGITLRAYLEIENSQRLQQGPGDDPPAGGGGEQTYQVA